MPSLWDYVQEYPGRLRDQFTQGMQQFARTRNPVAALGALNPTTPFIQDAALQAGGLIAPQANQLNQAVSQASENLGLGPLSIPEVTDEQLAPFLMLGMGSPTKMGFFSPSGKALTTAPGKGTSQQYLAHLKKEPGATKEAKQTGLIQKLEEAPGTLTKEEVVSMWNPIELTETVKTAVDTKGAANLDSPFAIPEVMRAARNAVNADDLALTIANDGDAFRALERQFPNLTDQDDWEEIVVRDIWGRQDQPANVTRYGNSEGLNLPGGEGPKEILVQLPDKGAERLEQIDSRLSSIKTTIENAGDMSRYDNFKPEVKASIYEQRDKLLKEQADLLSEKEALNANPLFRGGHWDEPNVLAHIRTNKRDVGGVRALHAEEFQSDWHQQGQKKGYVDADQKRVLESRLAQIEEEMKASNHQIAGDDNAGLLKKLDGDTSGLNVMIWRHPEGGLNFADRNQNVANDYASIGNIDRNGNLSTTKYTTPEQKILLEKHAELVKEFNSTKNELNEVDKVGKVPDAPYKKDWHELAFKRFLMEGINDPSVDRITWTSGDVQADRYDLSKHLSEVHLSGSNFVAYDHDGNTVIKQTGVRDEDLPDLIGKEAAEKLLAQPKEGTLRSLTGLDLQVGGEFHKQLYDKKIPQFAKKFLKKYGVEPQRTSEQGDFEEYEIIADDESADRTDDQHDLWRGDEWIKSFPTRKAAEDYLNKEQNLWYIDITPEMRQDLQQKGVPLAMNNRKPLLAYA